MVKIGEKAPEFNVKAYEKGKFTTVKLSDYKGKWCVLFFYPRDFTFICPTELTGFATRKTEFKALNCEVIAASTDSEHSHKAWFERDLKDIQYPVIADTNHQISRSYGVLNEENGESERGTFIIDPKGIIRYMVVSDSGVGRSVSETLRVLQALQTGELCPVEWAPGKKTLGKK